MILEWNSILIKHHYFFQLINHFLYQNQQAFQKYYFIVNVMTQFFQNFLINYYFIYMQYFIFLNLQNLFFIGFDINYFQDHQKILCYCFISLITDLKNFFKSTLTLQFQNYLYDHCYDLFLQTIHLKTKCHSCLKIYQIHFYENFIDYFMKSIVY